MVTPGETVFVTLLVLMILMAMLAFIAGCAVVVVSSVMFLFGALP